MTICDAILYSCLLLVSICCGEQIFLIPQKCVNWAVSPLMYERNCIWHRSFCVPMHNGGSRCSSYAIVVCFSESSDSADIGLGKVMHGKITEPLFCDDHIRFVLCNLCTSLLNPVLFQLQERCPAHILIINIILFHCCFLSSLRYYNDNDNDYDYDYDSDNDNDNDNDNYYYFHHLNSQMATTWKLMSRLSQGASVYTKFLNTWIVLRSFFTISSWLASPLELFALRSKHCNGRSLVARDPEYLVKDGILIA